MKLRRIAIMVALAMAVLLPVIYGHYRVIDEINVRSATGLDIPVGDYVIRWRFR